MADQTEVAIRASQGNIEASGVDDNALPVAGNLFKIAHGTTLQAARTIAHDGISRSGRLRVRFY